MKILLLITGLGIGGAEKVVCALADALIMKGYEVMLVYITGPALTLPSNPAVKVENLGMVSKFGVIAAFAKLRRLIRIFRPDVVHSHMIHANVLARLVRLITSIPLLVSTAHNSYEGGRLRTLAYRWTDSLPDISTNVSVEAVNSFLKIRATAPGRMIPIHNGISTSDFSYCDIGRRRVRESLGVKDNCELILAVGRLHEAKDYPNLFQALSRLRSKGLSFVLCIAGDGPLRGAFQMLISDLNLSEHIRFLGIRYDVADLMSAADVFVLSSAWEGFGLVVAEAMACERVVVATDCGGVREVLGEAGFLVPPRNPVALADALATALQLPFEERTAVGVAARKRVMERYSLNISAQNWTRIYGGVFDFSYARGK
ncbi:glycosyltransferase [Variovorax sp. J22R115]|uniref:glycosyltransferase n=1 Tax=Variovorax sp. J22R115 TaxID=3053509 RepID=UPI0025763A2D|nr:glycosyltransferase [Variovorax sp. J22R115]MDM0053468.1 glycosyltransferase [Variovorax sp. J22R115]